MNTQAIGRTNSWTEFQRLTQAARMRNGVLSSAGQTPETQASASVKSSPMPSIRSASVHQASPVTPKQSVTTRILGGLFDAYA